MRGTVHRPALAACCGALALGALTISQSGYARPNKPLDPAAKMPPLKPAVIDDSLEIGGAQIDARKVHTRLAVEVGVNGTGPYRFIVDSGADTSVIGERLAKALKMKPGRLALLNGITETRLVSRVMVDALRLGTTAFENLELPQLKESDIGAAGMIGLDALVEQRLMLDFESRKISVDDGRLPTPRLDGEIVVTARLKRGQLILTQVRAKGLALSAVVDTGSEISIGNSALKAAIIKHRRSEIQDIEVTGVTGATIKMQLAIVDDLRIGSIVLNNVAVAFADVPPFEVFGLEKQPALLLGTDLMESFRRISLDFHNRKVRFQLRRCTAQGIVLSTSAIPSRISAAKDNPSVCSR